MTTPLRPTIALTDRSGLTVCGCCGTEDGTVRMLTFRWEDVSRKPVQGGGTAVALCIMCRGTTLAVLANDLHGDKR